MDIIESVAGVLKDILFTSGLPLRMGIMIAVAIVVGYFLYDDLSLWIRVTVTVILFVFFEEWMRALVLADVTGYIPNRAIVFAIVSAVAFGAGITTGMVLSHRAKVIRILTREKTDQVIEGIKNTRPVIVGKKTAGDREKTKPFSKK